MGAKRVLLVLACAACASSWTLAPRLQPRAAAAALRLRVTRACEQPATEPEPAAPVATSATVADEATVVPTTASTDEMGPKDYFVFFGYIASFLAIFYAIGFASERLM